MPDRKPTSETDGAKMTLERLPHLAHEQEPWMVEGKTYRVALRRWSTKGMPQLAVYDPKSGKELAELEWSIGAPMFGLTP